MTTEGNREERRISGFEDSGNASETLGIPPVPLGQSYPQHYPQAREALGEPLSVRQVARLLGCSDWTVRHGYLPRGLPHLRSGPLGKLVFFEKQVIRWVLQQQRKGGN
jgi:hypothetical protein